MYSCFITDGLEAIKMLKMKVYLRRA